MYQIRVKTFDYFTGTEYETKYFETVEEVERFKKQVSKYPDYPDHYSRIDYIGEVALVKTKNKPNKNDIVIDIDNTKIVDGFDDVKDVTTTSVIEEKQLFDDGSVQF